MDLDSLADRLDKLANRRASFEAVKGVAELLGPEQHTSLLMLETALEHKRIRQHFANFVEQLYAAENLYFYEAVSELEQVPPTLLAELDTQSKQIVQQFILHNAPTPVNLPSSLSMEIRDCTSVKPRCVALSRAKREILRLMQTNFFYKFLATVVRKDETELPAPPPLPLPSSPRRAFTWQFTSSKSFLLDKDSREEMEMETKEEERKERLETEEARTRGIRKRYGKLLLDAVMRRRIHQQQRHTARRTPITTKSWVDVHVMLQAVKAEVVETKEEEDDEGAGGGRYEKPASLRRLRAISQHDRQACQAFLLSELETAAEPQAIQAQIAELAEFELAMGGQTLELEEEVERQLVLELKSQPASGRNSPRSAWLVLLLAMTLYWLLMVARG
ncbi:hypothetical protein BASA81_002131 [Batrachochytrium salamandrivorans]|nr:hypothetical protein BASA81_002131 [Batrachochytrium salamandrivorans]